MESMHRRGASLLNSEVHAEVDELFRDEQQSIRYGAAFLTVALFGLVGNVVAACVFLHRSMRSPGTTFLVALLFVDCFRLICVVLVLFPSSWLTQNFSGADSPGFFDALGTAQRIFVAAYPLEGLMHSCSVWFMLLYAHEFFCFLASTRNVIMACVGNSPLKEVMSVAFLLVLVQLLYFFSFQISAGRYKDYSYTKLCLSDLYLSESMERYEKHIFPILFYVAPYCLIFALSVMCLVALRRKAPEELEASSGLPIAIKSGRSTKMAFSILLVFLLLEGATQAVYFTILDSIDFNANPNGCYIVPRDRKFINAPVEAELCYYFFQLVQSSCNIVVIAASSKSFRDVFVRFARTCRSRTTDLYYRTASGVSRHTSGRPPQLIEAISDSYSLDGARAG